MHTWSAMRRKLETEYLAESLRGRLTYFVTCYHKTHDGDEGRAAIRLDGCEILKSNYYERYGAMWQAYEMRKAVPGADLSESWRQAAYDALHDGTFYQADFYRAFREFHSYTCNFIKAYKHCFSARPKVCIMLYKILCNRTKSRLRS